VFCGHKLGDKVAALIPIKKGHEDQTRTRKRVGKKKRDEKSKEKMKRR